jgi:uncharacterized protein with HEPN domain
MRADDRQRLADILAAAEAAIAYAQRPSRTGKRDELILDALTYRLMVVGEAANAVSDATRQAHPELPWRQMIGMRNWVVHAYWKVDRDNVLETVASDLPALVAKLRPIVSGQERT